MRQATVSRATKETNITLTLELDGKGCFSGSSGIGFLDHMLDAFAVHSKMDLTLVMTGDLQVDCHHSVEDLGILLGQAFAQAIGKQKEIVRYGSFFIPMDEALAFCSLDVSGRPFLVFDAKFYNQQVGEFDCCMVGEFFRAFAMHAGLTLHLRLLYGDNDHHKIEALFKAFAHALCEAVVVRENGVLSSKGSID